VTGKIYTPAALPSRKEPRCLSVRSLSGLHSWRRHFRGQDVSACAESLVRCLVSVLNELSQHVLSVFGVFLAFLSLRFRQRHPQTGMVIFPKQWNHSVRVMRVVCSSRNRTAVLKICLLHAFVAKVKKDKSKIVLYHAFNVYRGSRGIAPLMLNLGARWKCVIIFTSLPLERTPVPIEWEAGWASNAVWTFWRRKCLLPLPGFKPLAVRPVGSL
jgi:hypothetical protein